MSIRAAASRPPIADELPPPPYEVLASAGAAAAAATAAAVLRPWAAGACDTALATRLLAAVPALAALPESAISEAIVACGARVVLLPAGHRLDGSPPAGDGAAAPASTVTDLLAHSLCVLLDGVAEYRAASASPTAGLSNATQLGPGDYWNDASLLARAPAPWRAGGSWEALMDVAVLATPSAPLRRLLFSEAALTGEWGGSTAGADATLAELLGSGVHGFHDEAGGASGMPLRPPPRYRLHAPQSLAEALEGSSATAAALRSHAIELRALLHGIAANNAAHLPATAPTTAVSPATAGATPTPQSWIATAPAAPLFVALHASARHPGVSVERSAELVAAATASVLGEGVRVAVVEVDTGSKNGAAMVRYVATAASKNLPATGASVALQLPLDGLLLAAATAAPPKKFVVASADAVISAALKSAAPSEAVPNAASAAPSSLIAAPIAAAIQWGPTHQWTMRTVGVLVAATSAAAAFTPADGASLAAAAARIGEVIAAAAAQNAAVKTHLGTASRRRLAAAATTGGGSGPASTGVGLTAPAIMPLGVVSLGADAEDTVRLASQGGAAAAAASQPQPRAPLLPGLGSGRAAPLQHPEALDEDDEDDGDGGAPASTAPLLLPQLAGRGAPSTSMPLSKRLVDVTSTLQFRVRGLHAEVPLPADDSAHSAAQQSSLYEAAGESIVGRRFALGVPPPTRFLSGAIDAPYVVVRAHIVDGTATAAVWTNAARLMLGAATSRVGGGPASVSATWPDALSSSPAAAAVSLLDDYAPRGEAPPARQRRHDAGSAPVAEWHNLGVRACDVPTSAVLLLQVQRDSDDDDDDDDEEDDDEEGVVGGARYDAQRRHRHGGSQAARALQRSLLWAALPLLPGSTATLSLGVRHVPLYAGAPPPFTDLAAARSAAVGVLEVDVGAAGVQPGVVVVDTAGSRDGRGWWRSVIGAVEGAASSSDAADCPASMRNAAALRAALQPPALQQQQQQHRGNDGWRPGNELQQHAPARTAEVKSRPIAAASQMATLAALDGRTAPSQLPLLGRSQALYQSQSLQSSSHQYGAESTNAATAQRDRDSERRGAGGGAGQHGQSSSPAPEQRPVKTTEDDAPLALWGKAARELAASERDALSLLLAGSPPPGLPLCPDTLSAASSHLRAAVWAARMAILAERGADALPLLLAAAPPHMRSGKAGLDANDNAVGARHVDAAVRTLVAAATPHLSRAAALRMLVLRTSPAAQLADVRSAAVAALLTASDASQLPHVRLQLLPVHLVRPLAFFATRRDGTPDSALTRALLAASVAAPLSAGRQIMSALHVMLRSSSGATRARAQTLLAVSFDAAQPLAAAEAAVAAFGLSSLARAARCPLAVGAGRTSSLRAALGGSLFPHTLRLPFAAAQPVVPSAYYVAARDGRLAAAVAAAAGEEVGFDADEASACRGAAQRDRADSDSTDDDDDARSGGSRGDDDDSDDDDDSGHGAASAQAPRAISRSAAAAALVAVEEGLSLALAPLGGYADAVAQGLSLEAAASPAALLDGAGGDARAGYVPFGVDVLRAARQRRTALDEAAASGAPISSVAPPPPPPPVGVALPAAGLCVGPPIASTARVLAASARRRFVRSMVTFPIAPELDEAPSPASSAAPAPQAVYPDVVCVAPSPPGASRPLRFRDARVSVVVTAADDALVVAESVAAAMTSAAAAIWREAGLPIGDALPLAAHALHHAVARSAGGGGGSGGRLIGLLLAPPESRTIAEVCGGGASQGGGEWARVAGGGAEESGGYGRNALQRWLMSRAFNSYAGERRGVSHPSDAAGGETTEEGTDAFAVAVRAFGLSLAAVVTLAYVLRLGPREASDILIAPSGHVAFASLAYAADGPEGDADGAEGAAAAAMPPSFASSALTAELLAVLGATGGVGRASSGAFVLTPAMARLLSDCGAAFAALRARGEELLALLDLHTVSHMQGASYELSGSRRGMHKVYQQQQLPHLCCAYTATRRANPPLFV